MYGIVVHGGAGGTSRAAERGCSRAATFGMEILREGGSALDAAVVAVESMENSGIFNAGVGSILRIDGETIEMDAVVATSGGVQGAVGAVRCVKNPVLLAVAITKTRHMMLTGEGARAYAQQIGLEPHPGPTRRTQKRYESMRKAIAEGRLEAVAPGWTSEDLDMLWGTTDGAAASTMSKGCDTVGAIALDRNGEFAVASSTGGSGIMLPGRVGDVPVRGSGYEIGPLGGVLATGIGEEIIRRQGSGGVYELFGVEPSVREACEKVVGLFPTDVPVGFIALTREGVGRVSNYPMPSYSVWEEAE